jgi:hypothetical protein
MDQNVEGRLVYLSDAWAVTDNFNSELLIAVHPEDAKYLMSFDEGKRVLYKREIYTTETEITNYLCAKILGMYDRDYPIEEVVKEPTKTYTQILMDTELLKQRLDIAEKKMIENTKLMNKLTEELLNRTCMKRINNDTPSGALEINYISKSLNEAREHGLEAEVVMMALISMRRDPSQTLVEAMEAGMEEWIK